MSRWIDADALKEDLLINHNTDLMSQSLVLGSGFNVGVDYVMLFIEGAPSISLVRCGECKHRENYPCKVYHDDDWFCADGEREGE